MPRSTKKNKKEASATRLPRCCEECGVGFWQYPEIKQASCRACEDIKTPRGVYAGRVNPNLNPAYFHDIDTKERAYWLGFMAADGYVGKNKSLIRFELGKKDRDWLVRFARAVGAEESRIRPVFYDSGVENTRLTISCVHMVKGLATYGCGNRKSLTIRLPEMGCEELDLAYLMGYFDGDGMARTTALCCGSVKLLRDLRRKYGVKNKIYLNSKKTCYLLSLGAPLFRKMLANYPNSMPRKRCMNNTQHLWFQKHLISHEVGEFDESLKQLLSHKKEEKSRKQQRFDVSKEELQALIAKMPIVQIGRMFGVSDVAIHKRARKLDIKKPEPGYWQKQEAKRLAGMNG